MDINKKSGYYKPEFINQYSIDEDIIGFQKTNINFQDGAIKEVGINGCQITDILDICIHQLEQFQTDKLACKENEDTLYYLHSAQNLQQFRTKNREKKGVEGTNIP